MIQKVASPFLINCGFKVKIDLFCAGNYDCGQLRFPKKKKIIFWKTPYKTVYNFLRGKYIKNILNLLLFIYIIFVNLNI